MSENPGRYKYIYARRRSSVGRYTARSSHVLFPSKQIVTVTLLHSVDAIGSMLSERFLPESGQHLRFNIDGRNFAGAR